MDEHPALSAFRRAAPERAGIFSDFDGTLSEIVADPGSATPVRGTVATLRALAARYRVVAVISGRPVLDLRRRLRVPRVRLSGIHGLEEANGRRVRLPPAADVMRNAVERAARAVQDAAAAVPGVVVERKGLSAAVHFRRASDPDGARRMLNPAVHTAAAAEGLAVVAGRMVLEMRPPSGGDKGDALARIAAEHRLEAILVAGDDVGDLALFVAATAAAPVVCRIGIASDEAPPELDRATDVILPGPRAFVALLRSLA